MQETITVILPEQVVSVAEIKTFSPDPPPNGTRAHRERGREQTIVAQSEIAVADDELEFSALLDIKREEFENPISIPFR
jgi:hypothetical protein